LHDFFGGQGSVTRSNPLETVSLKIREDAERNNTLICKRMDIQVESIRSFVLEQVSCRIVVNAVWS